MNEQKPLLEYSDLRDVGSSASEANLFLLPLTIALSAVALFNGLGNDIFGGFLILGPVMAVGTTLYFLRRKKPWFVMVAIVLNAAWAAVSLAFVMLLVAIYSGWIPID